MKGIADNLIANLTWCPKYELHLFYTLHHIYSSRKIIQNNKTSINKYL